MCDIIERLLADPEKQEALVWLQSSTEKCEHALGEKTQEEAVSELQELYALGATTVWAVEIMKDDDLEESGKIVIELPSDAEPRAAVFTWAADWAADQGFDPEVDEGQTHLFVMLD